MTRIIGQQSQAQKKYWEDKVYIVVAALGLSSVGLALVIGIVLGLYTGDLIGGSATDSQQSQGIIAGWDKVVKPIMFSGIALLMTAVVLVLRTIMKTIKYEGAARYLPLLLTNKGGK